MGALIPTVRTTPGLLGRLGLAVYWTWLGIAALLLTAACISPTSIITMPRTPAVAWIGGSALFALVGRTARCLLSGGTTGMEQRAVGFPGAIYYRGGKGLDPTAPDLPQEQMDACLHCSIIPDWDDVTVARMWLLADDATADVIPPVVMREAVELMLAGSSIMILARRLEPLMDVRDGLLDALDLLSPPADVVGRA